MSLSLLWATVLFSQDALAYTSVNQPLSFSSDATAATEAELKNEEDTLKKVIQYFSHEATPSVVTITLQPAATTPAKLAFAFPADESIHPSAARAPGVSYLSKFFSTSIQPNAP